MNFVSALAAVLIGVIAALAIFAVGLAVGVALTERAASAHARSGGAP